MTCRELSKGFNFYTTSPIKWGMGRAATVFYKRLTAMLNEKRDSHTANDGVNMFPLELCVSLLISSQNIQA